MPTQDEMVNTRNAEVATILQERRDATQVTAEEKTARQVSLRTQIDSQHATEMATATNVAMLAALRSGR